jgi:hypothetical protein
MRICSISCFLIILALASAPAVNAMTDGEGLRFTTVTVTKTQPYELNLSYPRFEGTPVTSVEGLNKWIKQKIPTCDGGAKDNKNSLIYVTLEVRKLNSKVAVIKEAGETFCDGNAHPNQGLFYHFISMKTVRAVNLWDLLPPKGKQSIIQRLVKAGQELPEDDDCKFYFTAELMQDRFVSVEYKDDHTLTLLPSFPHVGQACEDRAETDIAIDDFKKLYAPQSPAIAILDGIQH